MKEKTFPIRTSSLSVNGCYIEMIFTLELGTKVELALTIDKAKMISEGIVVSRDFKVGNGIRFTKMAEEDKIRLRFFLAAIP